MKNRDYTFYDTLEYKLVLSLSLGVFFYLFMLFFLPFGVDNYDPNHEYSPEFLVEMSFFAIPLLVVSLLNEFLLRPLIFKNATLVKIIFWSVWTLFLMSSLMFIIYNYLGNWHDFRLGSYLEFLVQLPAVLLFPMTGVFFYFQYRSLRHQYHHILNTPESSNTAANNPLLHFKGAGNRDEISLSASAFLYGRAQDNYVELYHLKDGEERKFVMRATLSKLSETIRDEKICRCHRSFLVNLRHVKMIKGGPNDTTLTLSPLDHLIPVSRTYRKEILELLRV